MPLLALGGAPLLGTELARFAYFDEAGKSETEPHLVVAAILVHGDEHLDKLYLDLEAVVENRIPEEYRNGLVLHAFEIYGGCGKTFDKRKNPYWTWERRAPILMDLARIASEGEFVLAARWVKRGELPAEIQLPEGSESLTASRTVVAHAVAYCSCLLLLDMWLRRNAAKENCMVILEDVEDARAAIRHTHRYYQNKALPMPDDLKDCFPLQRIREDPAFQPKKPSSPLVLADFVAFMVKRRLLNDRRIAPFFDPWAKRLLEAAPEEDGLPPE